MAIKFLQNVGSDVELNRVQNNVAEALRHLENSLTLTIEESAAAAGSSFTAVYLNAGAQTLTSGTTIRVQFDTAETASSAVATGASWLFTAPAAATYAINATVGVVWGSPIQALHTLKLNKNAAVLRTVEYSGIRKTDAGFQSGGATCSLQISVSLALVAGDTISLDIVNGDPGGASTTIGSNAQKTWISIVSG